MTKFYSSMYGGAKQPPIVPVLTPDQKQTAATRVLAGMKVHGSQSKQVMIGEDLIDVPKIEYVKLLDEQVRNVRGRLKVMEDRYQRLLANHNKSIEEINKLHKNIAMIKKDLDGKINLR